MNFRRSIIIAEVWRPEVARRWENFNFCVFLEKRPLTGKFSEFCRCIWARESHFRSCKTTSGRKTTTSGLTETANTAVGTRRSLVNNLKASIRQKSTLGNLRHPIFTCYWTGSNILGVGWRPVALCASLLATTQRNTRIMGENRLPTAISGQTESRNVSETA